MVGSGPPDGASRAVGNVVLQLEVEVASMLVQVTALMGAFFLQLLSSFFFYAQVCISCHFFSAHMISILLDMHFLHPLGVAVLMRS